jgi:hypothetical protein
LTKEEAKLKIIDLVKKYFRSGYGKKLREFLSTKTTIEQIIDFGDAPVFDAITYPSIIVLRKSPPRQNEARIFTWNPAEQIEKFSIVVASNSSTVSQKELTANSWHLESKSTLNKILAVKSKDPKADVAKLERQIDQLVYQLYNLIPEEIDLVEEKF